MTDLAQIALDFCRECLGWQDAKLSMWGQSSNKMVVVKHGRDVVKRLRYGDLNAVMNAVRTWRDEMQEVLYEHVTATLSCASGDYIGHAFIGFRQPTTVKSKNACHTLMAACVEASRKLEAAA